MSLLLCSCDVFWALINSLCWFCSGPLGLVLFLTDLSLASSEFGLHSVSMCILFFPVYKTLFRLHSFFFFFPVFFFQMQTLSAAATTTRTTTKDELVIPTILKKLTNKFFDRYKFLLASQMRFCCCWCCNKRTKHHRSDYMTACATSSKHITKHSMCCYFGQVQAILPGPNIKHSSTTSGRREKKKKEKKRQREEEKKKPA